VANSADALVATAHAKSNMTTVKHAKFHIGQVVQHRLFPFRGLIFDIDPEFANTEAWWLSIPEDIRPRKDQPFYHLYAENAESTYEAYVSEQNLVPDTSAKPVRHPDILETFDYDGQGRYTLKRAQFN
jgi:heat shock protein HspQ